jgi:hypothetical protein
MSARSAQSKVITPIIGDMSSSKNYQSVTTALDSEIVPGISINDCNKLCASKCKDLNLSKFTRRDEKFTKFIKDKCVNRKFILKDAGIGVTTSETI